MGRWEKLIAFQAGEMEWGVGRKAINERQKFQGTGRRSV